MLAFVGRPDGTHTGPDHLNQSTHPLLRHTTTEETTTAVTSLLLLRRLTLRASPFLLLFGHHTHAFDPVRRTGPTGRRALLSSSCRRMAAAEGGGDRDGALFSGRKVHQSALALLPEETSPLHAAIQTIRKEHDKHFQRWMPHINVYVRTCVRITTDSASHDPPPHSPLTSPTPQFEPHTGCTPSSPRENSRRRPTPCTAPSPTLTPSRTAS